MKSREKYARSWTLSNHSGVDERPQPGWSGTITSYDAASVSIHGVQFATPPAPCK
jgi:hypothetical protein